MRFVFHLRKCAIALNPAFFIFLVVQVPLAHAQTNAAACTGPQGNGLGEWANWTPYGTSVNPTIQVRQCYGIYGKNFAFFEVWNASQNLHTCVIITSEGTSQRWGPFLLNPNDNVYINTRIPDGGSISFAYTAFQPKGPPNSPFCKE